MNKKHPHKVKWHKRDEKELIQEISDAYFIGVDNLNMGLDAFEGKSILSKINDWQDTYNGRPIFEVESRMNPEDLLFLFKFARAQLKNQLSIVNQANIKAEYEAIGDDSMTSQVVSKAYKVTSEYYENLIGKKALTLRSMLLAGVEGTSIEEVSIDKESYVGDIIEQHDQETGAFTLEEVEEVRYNGPRIDIHRVHEFLIANPFEDEIQKQPWVILRKTVPYDTFWAEYKGYPGAENVKAGEYEFSTDDGKPNNSQDSGDVTGNTEDDDVEIVRFFRKRDNLYAIVCNGVILYQGPILSKKCNYPFEKRIHEPVDGTSLFWASSFMEGMGSEQGLVTMALNLMNKKFMQSANPILMTESEEDFFDGDYLEIGMTKKVEDIVRTKILQFPGVDGGDMNFVNTIREALQNNSNQAQGGGSVTAPGGGTGTARQVVTAQEQAMRVIGLNATHLEECERKIKILFLDVIREFVSTPEIEKISKASGEVMEKLSLNRDVKVKNQKLKGGRRGTVLIHFYDKSEYYNAKGEKITHKKRSFKSGKIEDTGEPKVNELMTNTKNQAKKAEEQGEPMDIMYVPIDVFRDFDYDIQVVPGSSSSDSRKIEFEKRQMFIQTIAPFLGQSLNGVEIAAFFGEVYDYDVERFIMEQQPMDPQQQAMEQAMGQFDPMEEGAILQEFTA